MSKSVKRLYEQFRPKHYDLHLTLNKTTMTFNGSVTITGQKTGRPSQRITLHQKGLSISKATIIHEDKLGNKEVAITRINSQKTYDEVRLHTGQNMRSGTYTVNLEFSGTITRPMNGIYPCFFEYEGKQEMLLATQFESHHAREAFPCIDEPEAKATFDLTLTTEVGEAVIANTPVKQQTTTGSAVTTSFETTPIMSTYLLAFVTGKLERKQKTTKQGVLVSAYATPAEVKFTDFALDVAVKSLEFYDDYFGIPYPLEKCDMIALPDFASGAMENWGCITYREQCMLVDPANTSLPTKQYVAMVVAHELAHQWFGNLVTMRWWTDLWLNEGFASWIEYLAVDHIFPEWDMWTQFIVDEQLAAFKLDALEHTHPIEVAVHHPDEIRTIFDTISYAKGSSVIHMLHEYLGRDAFRDGLRHYLKQHAYSNTDTIDLWQSLETISKKPVRAFMHAWTSQPGFPIVKAELKDQSLQLSQETFYVNRNNIPDAKPLLWPVPLLSDDSSLPDELTKQSGSYTVTEGELLKINRNQSGFYRTIYDHDHTLALAAAVKNNTLEPLDRLSLLSDLFEAAKAGYTTTTDALALLEAYSNEDHSVVWDSIAVNIGELRLVMGSDELRDVLKPYIRTLVKTQLKRLGWTAKKGEAHLDSLLRTTILGLAASADEPSVVKKCQEMFASMKRSEDIDPDLRGIVYGTVARLGGAAEFDKLLELHNSAVNSEERVVLTSALTSFRQPELIKRALAQTNSDNVRLQDSQYWLVYSFVNRHAREAAWEWLKENWGWLEANLGSDLSFYRFPIYAARGFSDTAFLKDYTAFFASVDKPGLERSVKQGQEIVEWHADWKQRDYDSILKYFSSIK